VRLSITDDGVGGADPARGSGLIGLSDRIGAIGGKLAIDSPEGHGTSIFAELPAVAG
jgi:signal transduction histidine kinase